MTALRVAIVAGGDLNARSGAARNLRQLLSGLRAGGHEVLQVLGDDRQLSGDGIEAAIRERQRLQAIDLERAFRSWRPEVVHIEYAAGTGLPALRVAEALRLPVTTYWHRLHEIVPPVEREQALAALLAFHRRTARTFVDAEEDARFLREHGVPGIVLAGRGVDTRLFAPDARTPSLRRAWEADEDDCVLLHVGRLLALKNPALLVDAAEAARAAQPRTRLVIVGEGPEKAMLRERLPWAVFTGTLGDDTLAEVYASADAFLFPSLVDTYGNVVLEAMASGLAVVAFARGAARHIDDGVDGHRVPVADGSAFIAATIASATDVATARRIGTAARTKAMTLSVEAAVGRISDELRAVARRA